MRHHKTFRGAFRRKLKKFGDLITFDYSDITKVYDQGYHLDHEILVVRDRFTGLMAAYPSPSKNKDDVLLAIKRVLGKHKCGEAYSDKAPQFEKADPCRDGHRRIPWLKGITTSS